MVQIQNPRDIFANVKLDKWNQKGSPLRNIAAKCFASGKSTYTRNYSSSWVEVKYWAQNWSELVTQSCLTLCDAMDCSLPVSSVHGILQARILEWVAISSSSRSPGMEPRFLHCRRILYCLSHRGSPTEPRTSYIIFRA